MKKVQGINLKVMYDNTGGFVFVDWYCPYCNGYNAGMYFSSKSVVLADDFELDHECDDCGKMVTIICENAEREYREEDN